MDRILLDFIKNIFIKGTVHPKMSILSVITHPHVVPTSQDSFIFGTQIKIFLIKSVSWITPP